MLSVQPQTLMTITSYSGVRRPQHLGQERKHLPTANAGKRTLARPAPASNSVTARTTIVNTVQHATDAKNAMSRRLLIALRMSHGAGAITLDPVQQVLTAIKRCVASPSIHHSGYCAASRTKRAGTSIVCLDKATMTINPHRRDTGLP